MSAPSLLYAVSNSGAPAFYAGSSNSGHADICRSKDDCAFDRLDKFEQYNKGTSVWMSNTGARINALQATVDSTRGMITATGHQDDTDTLAYHAVTCGTELGALMILGIVVLRIVRLIKSFGVHKI